MIEEWNSLAVPWALDERFSGLAERVNEGVREADLTGADRQSLHLMFLNVNQVWQFRYRQLQVGVISADDVQFPDPERNTWFNSDFHRDVWPYNRQEFDPGFAAFWEERFNLGGN